ncbi:MAG: thioredoxin family protein [Acidobacteriota bacterium]
MAVDAPGGLPYDQLMDTGSRSNAFSASALSSPGFVIAILGVVVVVAATLAVTRVPVGGLPGPQGDIVTIARGEEIQVKEHLVPEKYTVIDFYADWCATCRKVTPVLEEFARHDSIIALRKVNVVSWDSPVAQQYGLKELPYLLLYDPQGKLLAQGENVVRMLERLIS